MTKDEKNRLMAEIAKLSDKVRNAKKQVVEQYEVCVNMRRSNKAARIRRMMDYHQGQIEILAVVEKIMEGM